MLRTDQNRRLQLRCWASVLLIGAVLTIGFDAAFDVGAHARPFAAPKAFLKKRAPVAARPMPIRPGGVGAPARGPGVADGPKQPSAPLSSEGLVKGAGSKGPIPKSTATSALPKGADPKVTGSLPKATGLGPAGSAPKAAASDPKAGVDPKAGLGGPKGAPSALPKTASGPPSSPKGVGPQGVNPKGIGTGPKGTSPKGFGPKGFASPHLAASAPERAQLRLDHRQSILAAQRLLPPRPMPGERGFTGVPPTSERRFVPTELVFRSGPNVSRQALDDATRRLGLVPISTADGGIAGGNIHQFRVPPGQNVSDVVRSLEGQNIGVAQPNYTYRLYQKAEPPARPKTSSTAPAPAAATDPYVARKLHLDEVHKIATGNNVLIAVVDSLIDIRHPDLAGTVIEQFDAVGVPEPAHLHGTGMVGAIAAHQRLTGIAPRAKILAIRAFSAKSDQTPEATTRNILLGMDWAIKKGARIINMSFAGPYDPLLQLAMKNAHAKGVVLIAAAGNLGAASPPLYPAADPNVIAVTATDRNDKLFVDAVRGPHLAVAAPGVDIIVPAPGEKYQLTTGTSVAAAHVSAVAALLLERHPNASARAILEVLTASAKRLNPQGRDNLTGWGLIDPAAALAELDSRMDDRKVASVARPSGPKTTSALPTTVPPSVARDGAPKTLGPRPASVPDR